MELLGMSGVQAAIVITILGLALANVVGWLKSGNKFDPRMAAASAIIAIVITIPTMAATIGAIPKELNDLEQLAFIMTFIGQVAGFDTLGKGMIRAGKKARETKPKTP